MGAVPTSRFARTDLKQASTWPRATCPSRLCAWATASTAARLGVNETKRRFLRISVVFSSIRTLDSSSDSRGPWLFTTPSIVLVRDRLNHFQKSTELCNAVVSSFAARARWRERERERVAGATKWNIVGDAEQGYARLRRDSWKFPKTCSKKCRDAYIAKNTHS